MSELDEYFDVPKPKSKSQLRRLKIQMKTEWPGAPERLRPLLDKYEELNGFVVKAKRKSAINSAHRYYNVAGGDLRLFERAYRYAKRQGWMIKDLGTMMNAADWLKRKADVDPDSEDERRKYLEWDE